MANAQRKVIVRRFAGALLSGYLPLAAFVRSDAGVPYVDLLDLSGRVTPVPLSEVRTISYVRDFNLMDASNPERLNRTAFLARPRMEGLWVRVTFRGGDVLEGLAPTDLALLDSVVEDFGLHLVPPDTRSNTQRVFVPRSAMAELQIVAVVTTPSRKKPLPVVESSTVQETLFAHVRSDAPESDEGSAR